MPSYNTFKLLAWMLLMDMKMLVTLLVTMPITALILTMQNWCFQAASILFLIWMPSFILVSTVSRSKRPILQALPSAVGCVYAAVNCSPSLDTRTHSIITSGISATCHLSMKPFWAVMASMNLAHSYSG